MLKKGIVTALVAAGALIPAAGTASAAPASSPGCAFSNGCATLHGVDAANNAVAMDAKYQNPKEIVIGYPDLAGDGATNFDAVIHFTTGPKTTGYADTALQGSPPEGVSTITVSKATLIAGVLLFPSAITCKDDGITNTTDSITVTTQGGLSGGGSATCGSPSFSGTIGGTNGQIVLTVNGLTHNAKAVSILNVGTTVNPNKIISIDNVTAGPAANTLSPNVTFTGSSTQGALTSWTEDDMPPGLTGNLSSAGVLSPGAAQPDTYNWATVSGADGSGATGSVTFTLDVIGHKATTPGPNVPYYTFVYARNGVWSSQCVTDENGSGALNLQACTLGKDRYQDFYALNGSSAPQGNLQTDATAKFYIQDVLAAVSSPANSCLTDPSTLNPATPESDVVDEAASGRQLRVDGSCSAVANQWNWGS
jgi:hypothetical protein